LQNGANRPAERRNAADLAGCGTSALEFCNVTASQVFAIEADPFTAIVGGGGMTADTHGEKEVANAPAPSAAAGYPAFCRRRRSARVMRRRSALAIRRSGSSRSLSAIGHSYPHAWQHHIIVTDAPRIVCSGRTRPVTPQWRHFSGNRRRRKVGGTGEEPRYHSAVAVFHANSLCLNALRT